MNAYYFPMKGNSAIRQLEELTSHTTDIISTEEYLALCLEIDRFAVSRRYVINNLKIRSPSRFWRFWYLRRRSCQQVLDNSFHLQRFLLILIHSEVTKKTIYQENLPRNKCPKTIINGIMIQKSNQRNQMKCEFGDESRQSLNIQWLWSMVKEIQNLYVQLAEILNKIETILE